MSLFSVSFYCASFLVLMFYCLLSTHRKNFLCHLRLSLPNPKTTLNSPTLYSSTLYRELSICISRAIYIHTLNYPYKYRELISRAIYIHKLSIYTPSTHLPLSRTIHILPSTALPYPQHPRQPPSTRPAYPRQTPTTPKTTPQTPPPTRKHTKHTKHTAKTHHKHPPKKHPQLPYPRN